jgi:hypothetical protein
MDGLEQVEWATLRHAYGPARDVPVLLKRCLTGESRPWGPLLTFGGASATKGLSIPPRPPSMDFIGFFGRVSVAVRKSPLVAI